MDFYCEINDEQIFKDTFRWNPCYFLWQTIPSDYLIFLAFFLSLRIHLLYFLSFQQQQKKLFQLQVIKDDCFLFLLIWNSRKRDFWTKNISQKWLNAIFNCSKLTQVRLLFFDNIHKKKSIWKYGRSKSLKWCLIWSSVPWNFLWFFSNSKKNISKFFSFFFKIIFSKNLVRKNFVFKFFLNLNIGKFFKNPSQAILQKGSKFLEKKLIFFSKKNGRFSCR